MKEVEYKEKFIVINKKHLNNIPISILEQFDLAMEKIRENIPQNSYFVCNQDEPYADKVIKTILDGESMK